MIGQFLGLNASVASPKGHIGPWGTFIIGEENFRKHPERELGRLMRFLTRLAEQIQKTPSGLFFE